MRGRRQPYAGFTYFQAGNRPIFRGCVEALGPIRRDKETTRRTRQIKGTVAFSVGQTRGILRRRREDHTLDSPSLTISSREYIRRNKLF